MTLSRWHWTLVLQLLLALSTCLQSARSCQRPPLNYPVVPVRSSLVRRQADTDRMRALPSPDLPAFRHGKTCGNYYEYYGAYCNNNNGRTSWFHLLCRPDDLEVGAEQRPLRRPLYRCPNDALCFSYPQENSNHARAGWRPGRGPAPRIICAPRPPRPRRAPLYSAFVEEPDPDADKDTTGRDWEFGFVPPAEHPQRSRNSAGASSSTQPPLMHLSSSFFTQDWLASLSGPGFGPKD